MNNYFNVYNLALNSDYLRIMDQISNQVLFIALSSFFALILSILATKFYISIAHKYKLLSVPHQGGVRKDIVPTSGGISFGLIYIAFIVGLSYISEIPNTYFYSITFGSGAMLIMGFIDDIYGLSSGIRLVLQFLFVLFVSYLFGVDEIIDGTFEYLLLLPIIIFGSIWIINTFNFIDGADGLVSTNSSIFAFIGGVFLLINNETILALLLFILSTLNLGFLVYNWSPAKVFMGDSGSLFLGSIFVIFGIGAFTQDTITFWIWLILLSIFYIETTVTLLIRIKRKENALKVHHSHHAYQQIIISSGKHNRPAILSIILHFIWIIPMAILAYNYPEKGWFITLIACLPLLFLFYFFGPYRTKDI